MKQATSRPGWAAAPTRTGHTKAIGTGPHTGQILYGEAAERALHSKRRPGGDLDANGRPGRAEAATVAASREALSRLFRGEEMTAEDVRDFAAGAADVPFEEMQTAARVLAHRLREPA